MSIVAGCDVGSLTAKAAIMKEGKLVGSVIRNARSRPHDSARRVMDEALCAAGIAFEDIDCCVGTGYGRDQIGFTHETVSEISCHARGAKWLLPAARTVIDIGGQDCKIMKIDDEGNVLRFTANDKCASGTGRFLEVMARVLEVGIDELGGLSRKAGSPITLASTCTVWAQADVIKYINSGADPADIGAGVNTAMASRVAILVNSIKPEPDIFMTGGVAKNTGVVATLEKLLGCRMKKARKADPQMAGAIGAAIFAREKHTAFSRRRA